MHINAYISTIITSQKNIQCMVVIDKTKITALNKFNIAINEV